jgi:SWI/SNF-related matrix-associated actin-dependent regulator 1 of chromatin subfamily A
LKGELASFRPAEFLGGERFHHYRDAAKRAGAKYDKATKSYSCPTAQVPRFIELAEHAGLKPVVAPDLAKVLAPLAAGLRSDMMAAASGLQATEVKLAGRGLELYGHQREGIAWIAPRRRAALFDEMGLGKTITALCAIPEEVPVIVVCPAAVKHNWAAEARKWRPDMRVRVLDGRHKWEWPLAGAILVANDEVLPDLDKNGRSYEIPPRYGDPKAGTYLVADEAHYAKNATTKRGRALKLVAQAALGRDGRCWLMTGTPLTNKPPELWNVLKVAQLAEPAFGTYPQFRTLMGATVNKAKRTEWTGDIDASVPDRLRDVSLYRKRRDVLDLPALMRTTVEVPGEFPPDVRVLLDDVIEALYEQGVDLDAAAELVDLTKVTGAAFEQLSKARAALAIAKIPSMIDQVVEYEQHEEPLVVFSAHRAPIDVLSRRPGWAVITGAVTAAERTKIIEDFQAGKYKGVGCTIKAGGVGITLTRAAHIVFVDLDWTPAGNSQAEARCQRISQSRPVLVKRLVADHPLNRKVARVLRVNQELIDASVEPSAVLKPRTDHTADLKAQASRLERTLNGSALPPAGGLVIPTKKSPRPTPAPTGLREPATAVERWVCQGLLQLLGDDPDGARDRNGVGFNKVDQIFGRSLALRVQEKGALTEKQYTAAVRMLTKYHRQIGQKPEEETDE